MDKLIAHRGIYNDKIIENTFEGIKKALESDKYVGVEFDIRETLDNEIIVYHDAFYNNKLISKTYFKELPKYVPRLQDILKINSNKIFLIEIKNIENNYKKFFQILNKNINKNIYVMSFSNNVINKININERKYKIGILNYILNTSDDNKDLDFICILNNLLNSRIINELKGLEIFSYGIIKKKNYKDIFYIIDDK